MNLVVICVIVIVIILLLIICATGYVKAPPDKALIISGCRRKPKILIGCAGIKIPFLERKDFLLLKQISIDIKTNGYIPTKDFIGVDVDAVAKIRVLSEGEGLKNAMKNFLNMEEQDIVRTLTDSLQGNMREIIGTVQLQELSTNRKAFGDQVQQMAKPDMAVLGVEIISCNIQKISDERDLIGALGQDNMSQIQKTASIAKANAERDVAIAQAQAVQASNEEEVKAKTIIAQRENELSIKKSELKIQSDIKKAEADAAYHIQEQEQRKTIEIATADANIARQEKEIELKEKDVAVTEQTLAAQVKKKADADLYAAQKKAEAQKYSQEKDAEAQLFVKQKEAEGRLYSVKQDAEGIKQKGEAEASAIRVKGQAEAEAIKAKAIAEAEGIEKKAEAMQKMGEAAVLEMYFNSLPDVMKYAAEPLNNVDQIIMYGDGNSAKMVKDIVNNMSQVTEGIKQATGLDLGVMLSSFAGNKLAAGSPKPPVVDSDLDETTDVEE